MEMTPYERQLFKRIEGDFWQVFSKEEKWHNFLIGLCEVFGLEIAFRAKRINDNLNVLDVYPDEAGIKVGVSFEMDEELKGLIVRKDSSSCNKVEESSPLKELGIISFCVVPLEPLTEEYFFLCNRRKPAKFNEMFISYDLFITQALIRCVSIFSGEELSKAEYWPLFNKIVEDNYKNVVKEFWMKRKLKALAQPLFRPKRFESGFIGENLTLEEFESLKEDEKIYLQSTLEKENKDWLNQRFQELNVDWLAVVDGEVVAFSLKIDEYPDEDEILKLCEEKGKFPFIFINKRLLMIEESSSDWIETDYPGDYYPTAEIQLGALKKRFRADFDTGCSGYLYIGMEQAISEGLMSRPGSKEILYTAEHLGESFRFYVRPLDVGLFAEDGKVKKDKFSVFCVIDWGRSPFTKINRNRIALVGRRLFQKIEPTVVLKFKKRKTEIYF